MESLRRKIKIFWTEHGTPILFWALVVLGVIIIVQLLNNYAIQKNKNRNSTNVQTQNTIQQSNYSENKDYTALVNQFLNYCKNGQVEEAYEMLSENCKKDLYSTKQEFENKYYKKLFAEQKDTEMLHIEESNYEIRVYDSILETGSVENRKYTTATCKVEEEILGAKIYTNLK